MKASIVMKNGEIVCFSLKDLISSLIAIPMSYKYSSAEAMKANFQTCCDLVIEFCTLMKPEGKDADSKALKIELTRTITKMEKMRTMIEDFTKLENIEKFVYDVVLSFEGNGRLAGFMMASKHGDLIKQNPEVQSVSPASSEKKRYLKRKIVLKNEEKAEA